MTQNQFGAILTYAGLLAGLVCLILAGLDPYQLMEKPQWLGATEHVYARNGHIIWLAATAVGLGVPGLYYNKARKWWHYAFFAASALAVSLAFVLTSHPPAWLG
jgi:hypothetical protein